MTDIGYLNGTVKAYESEEDLKKLAMKSMILKPKQTGSDATDKNGDRILKAPDEKDIIL